MKFSKKAVKPKVSKLVLIPKILILINNGLMLYVSMIPQPDDLWLSATLIFAILSAIAFPYPKVGGILLLLFSGFIYLSYMWIGLAFEWFNFYDLQSLILFFYIIIAVLFVLFSFIKINDKPTVKTESILN